MLTDPEARAQAFRLAEELETKAAGLEGEAAAELLVKAAELYQTQVGDTGAATAILRRAVGSDPRNQIAIGRLKEIAESKGDPMLLSEVLELMLRTATDFDRVRILAVRADVLGQKLGRIAEARGHYRELARIVQLEPIKRAATEASEKIEQILGERRPGGAVRPDEWAPVAPIVAAHEELLRARGRGPSAARGEAIHRPGSAIRVEATIARGDSASTASAQMFRRAATHLERGEKAEARAVLDAALAIDADSEQGRQILKKLLEGEGKIAELVDAFTALAAASKHPARARSALREAAELAAKSLGDVDRALELYRRALDRDPVDEQTLAEAISTGIAQGIIDVVKRVLPRFDAQRRSEIIAVLAQGAAVVGDERAAFEYRAAAFEDAPGVVENFEAAVQVAQSAKSSRSFARILELRFRAARDLAERRALVYELANVRAQLGEPRAAAEALIESLRMAPGEEDVSEALAAIDRLSREAGDRSLLTHAFSAAAAREGLDAASRATFLRALARVLSELGDLDAANAVLAEAEAAMPAGGGDASAAEEAALDQPLPELQAPIVPSLGVEKTPSIPRRKNGSRSDPFSSLDPADDSAASARIAGVDQDWSKAVDVPNPDTLIDRVMTPEERETLRAAAAKMRERERSPQGRWVVAGEPTESVDGVRELPPLVDEDPDASSRATIADPAGASASAARMRPPIAQQDRISLLSFGDTIDESAGLRVKRIPVPVPTIEAPVELPPPSGESAPASPAADQRQIDTEDIPRPKRGRGEDEDQSVTDEESAELPDEDVDLEDLDTGDVEAPPVVSPVRVDPAAETPVEEEISEDVDITGPDLDEVIDDGEGSQDIDEGARLEAIADALAAEEEQQAPEAKGNGVAEPPPAMRLSTAEEETTDRIRVRKTPVVVPPDETEPRPMLALREESGVKIEAPLEESVPDAAAEPEGAERGEPERGESERAALERAESERGEFEPERTERGESEPGESERAESERGEAELAEFERGESERGESERGESELAEFERGEFERGESERGESERGESELAEFERGESQRGESELAESELAESELAESELAESELAESELAESERGESERAESERGESRAGESDAGESEPERAERGESERAESERAESERGESDAGESDAGEPEPERAERGESERGESERAESDAGESEPGALELAESEPARELDARGSARRAVPARDAALSPGRGSSSGHGIAQARDAESLLPRQPPVARGTSPTREAERASTSSPPPEPGAAAARGASPARETEASIRGASPSRETEASTREAEPLLPRGTSGRPPASTAPHSAPVELPRRASQPRASLTPAPQVERAALPRVASTVKRAPLPKLVDAEPPPTPRVVTAPKIDPPADPTHKGDLVHVRLRAGALDDALAILAASVVTPTDEIHAGLWLEAGRVAIALGRDQDAEVCLSRAVEHAAGHDAAVESAARRALVELHVRNGHSREAAAALVPLVSEAAPKEGAPKDAARATPDRDRAKELSEIGQLFARDRDPFMAKSWLEDALAADPACAPAALELARIYAEAKDREALHALARKMEAAQLAGASLAAWLRALAYARRELGELGAAREALARASIVDPLDLFAAEELFHLGRVAKREEWIDEALRELRVRSVEQGLSSRAFLAAAVLVARRAAREEDRMTYESLRVALAPRPTAPVGTEWIMRASHDSAAESLRVALAQKPAGSEGIARETEELAAAESLGSSEGIVRETEEPATAESLSSSEGIARERQDATDESLRVSPSSERIARETQEATDESPRVAPSSERIARERQEATDQSLRVGPSSERVAREKQEATDESPRVAPSSERIARERQETTDESLRVGPSSERIARETEDPATAESVRVGPSSEHIARETPAPGAESLRAAPAPKANARDSGEPAPEGPIFGTPIFGAPIEIEGTETASNAERAATEALQLAELVLGLPRIDVCYLESAGPCAVSRSPAPTIGLSRELATRGLAKVIRFEVARAVVALSDDRLAHALNHERATETDTPPATALLDRAALVLAGDPAVALDAIGPRSARGEALAAFAVSRALPDLWARLGLGIHRPVAKGAPRD